jgi:hypothetical protein
MFIDIFNITKYALQHTLYIKPLYVTAMLYQLMPTAVLYC